MLESHLHIPSAHRPEWLKGLRLPVSKDEAIDYAQRHGAPERALDFLEALPAAVFNSEDGLRHVFSTFGDEQLPSRGDLREPPEAEDGADS